MSSSVTQNPQIWRRSPELSPLDVPMQNVVDDCSLGGSASSGDSRERVVRFVMVWLSVIDWLREQWLLWLFFLSIAAAYYRPVSADVDTHLWTKVLVFVSFTLSGASFPDLDRSAAGRFVGLAALTGFLSLVILPVAGAAIYAALRGGVQEADYLFLGLMCAMCLPPSSILSVAATRSAQGSEPLAQYLSAIGNMCGVIASPLLMVSCVSFSYSSRLPNIMSVLLFPLMVLGPFLLGALAQRIFAWASHRRITGDSRDTNRMNNAQLACSELCDGSLIYWRRRAVQSNCLVMLVLNYLMFSSFFVQSTASALLTWSGVGLVVLLEVVLFAVTSLIGWLLTAALTDVPEERIALFFVVITKSEVLAIPMILFLFGDKKQVALILLPSLLYHLIQAFATSVLSFPIRRWRYRYNCRPGTTLLPLRLNKPARAPAGKSSA